MNTKNKIKLVVGFIFLLASILIIGFIGFKFNDMTPQQLIANYWEHYIYAVVLLSFAMLITPIGDK